MEVYRCRQGQLLEVNIGGNRSYWFRQLDVIVCQNKYGNRCVYTALTSPPHKTHPLPRSFKHTTTPLRTFLDSNEERKRFGWCWPTAHECTYTTLLISCHTACSLVSLSLLSSLPPPSALFLVSFNIFCTLFFSFLFFSFLFFSFLFFSFLLFSCPVLS